MTLLFSQSSEHLRSLHLLLNITCVASLHIFFCLSYSCSFTQSPLSCCWSQSRAVWGGSAGCDFGPWCCGAGLAPARYTGVSCARSFSSCPPSQSHPRPLSQTPSHAQLQLCWSCRQMDGPLWLNLSQRRSRRPWRCPGKCHLAWSPPYVPGKKPQVLAPCYCGCEHDCESCGSCESCG